MVMIFLRRVFRFFSYLRYFCFKGLSFLLPVLAIYFASVLSSFSNENVYVSRFWHNHQPLYWPDWNSNGSQTQRGQYAWDSIVLKPGQNYGGLSPKQHPENNLNEIFGVNDRVNSYQSGPRNSLAGLNSAAGFAISYSGSLIDNVRQLGSVNQLGYGSDWNSGFQESRGWKTPAGSPRMDLVGFTYHHSLAPLLPKSVFRKELQIFKQAWWKAWEAVAILAITQRDFSRQRWVTRDI
jgi:alpha-amylase/alpha-mannosidase (GH57 family)